MSKLLDSTRLQHMLEAAERIAHRLHDATLADFLSDEDLQDIALRRLMVIGEAAGHVSEQTKLHYTQIDWLGARRMRNYVAHEYFRVELSDVWDSVVNDVPRLVIELPAVIAQVQAHEQAQRSSGV